MHDPIAPIRFLDGELVLEHPDGQPSLIRMDEYQEHAHENRIDGDGEVVTFH